MLDVFYEKCTVVVHQEKKRHLPDHPIVQILKDQLPDGVNLVVVNNRRHLHLYLETHAPKVWAVVDTSACTTVAKILFDKVQGGLNSPHCYIFYPDNQGRSNFHQVKKEGQDPKYSTALLPKLIVASFCTMMIANNLRLFFPERLKGKTLCLPPSYMLGIMGTTNDKQGFILDLCQDVKDHLNPALKVFLATNFPELKWVITQTDRAP